MRQQCYRLGLKRLNVECRWVTHTLRREENRCARNALVGTSKGKRKLGRHRRTQQDNIKIILKETG